MFLYVLYFATAIAALLSASTSFGQTHNSHPYSPAYPLSKQPNWTASGEHERAYFGSTVSAAGDVNNDGFADILVSASPGYMAPFARGRVYLYLGSASGLHTEPAWVGEATQNLTDYGIKTASAGDVNGDGYGDILISEQRYYNLITKIFEERVYAYYGSATGVDTTPAWIIVGAEDSFMCWGISCAGDVNSDGYSDVVVSTFAAGNGRGRADIYTGSPQGLSTTASWSVIGVQENETLGRGVASGDFNGDGFPDIVVSAPYFGQAKAIDDEGAIFIYYGSSDGLDTVPGWKAIGESTGEYLGSSLSVGDVNNDGVSDIMATRINNTGNTKEPQIVVYYGSHDVMSTTGSAIISKKNYAFSVESPVVAGDINGDSYTDIIIGTYGYSNGQTYEGAAFLFPGSDQGMSAEAAWQAESDLDSTYFGARLACAGDVNGDGMDDILIGAYSYSDTLYRRGQAYMYYGRADITSVDSEQHRASFGAALECTVVGSASPLFLLLQSEQYEQLDVDIVDVRGRVLASNRVELVGEQRVSIALPKAATGRYYVCMRSRSNGGSAILPFAIVQE